MCVGITRGRYEGRDSRATLNAWGKSIAGGSDKGRVAPVLSCKDRHIFWHNLAGHSLPRVASAWARFRGALIRSGQSQEAPDCVDDVLRSDPIVLSISPLF
jgi:hypothetical protein